MQQAQQDMRQAQQDMRQALVDINAETERFMLEMGMSEGVIRRTRPQGLQGAHGPPGPLGAEAIQLGPDGTVEVNGRVYQTIGAASAGHQQVQGIRFPGNKAAYTSGALYAQQANLSTHDAGLQVLLMSILRAVRHMRPDQEWQLPDLKFTLNIGTATTRNTKRYAVNLSEPLVERISLCQTINPHTCAVEWRVIREDDSAFVLTEVLGGLQVRDSRPEDDPEERTRRIELD